MFALRCFGIMCCAPICGAHVVVFHQQSHDREGVEGGALTSPVLIESLVNNSTILLMEGGDSL